MKAYSLIKATAIGAVTQFRSLGGAVGLSIVTSVMKSSIKSRLLSRLPASSVTSILESAAAIDLLPKPLENQIRSLFAHEYKMQTRIVIGFTGAQFFFTFLIWRREKDKARRADHGHSQS